jgi:heat shock protein HslJ
MRSILATGLLIAAGIGGVAAAGDPLASWQMAHRARPGRADSLDAARTVFEVAADGQVSSTVGCNRIVGKPSLEGDRLRFGPMAATRMACPPPLDRLEAAYMAALDAVRSYRVEGARLILVDEAGQAAVVLARAEDARPRGSSRT